MASTGSKEQRELNITKEEIQIALFKAVEEK
jgi:hypothetical protein